MRLSLWAAATGAGKGVLDSDAGYIKAEPLLCFKYCLADEGMNEMQLFHSRSLCI